jgi:hypothetical protein
MSVDTTQAEDTGRARDSFRALLGQLVSQSVALFQDEIDLAAKHEVRRTVQGTLGGLVTVVIGVIVA